MYQSLFLFGIWETPLSNYWLFYLGFGLLGFALCYFHRLFIIPVIPLLLWFAISDLKDFYHYQALLNNNYIFQVIIAIFTSLMMFISGAFLNAQESKIND